VVVNTEVSKQKVGQLSVTIGCLRDPLKCRFLCRSCTGLVSGQVRSFWASDVLVFILGRVEESLLLFVKATQVPLIAPALDSSCALTKQNCTLVVVHACVLVTAQLWKTPMEAGKYERRRKRCRSCIRSVPLLQTHRRANATCQGQLSDDHGLLHWFKRNFSDSHRVLQRGSLKSTKQNPVSAQRTWGCGSCNPASSIFRDVVFCDVTDYEVSFAVVGDSFSPCHLSSILRAGFVVHVAAVHHIQCSVTHPATDRECNQPLLRTRRCVYHAIRLIRRVTSAM